MPTSIPIPSIIPGRLLLTAGAPDDYNALHRFHYLPKRPASFAAIWIIRHEHNNASYPAAVAIISYPTLALHARAQALNLSALSPSDRIAFVNAHIRSISRVIVHPQFRSLGLATRLVRHILDHAPTRYTEALAVMARAHPFFKRAGMTEFLPADPDKPIYYLFERGALERLGGKRTQSANDARPAPPDHGAPAKTKRASGADAI